MHKIFILFLITVFCYSKPFKIASYNVQNLFDLQKSGLEYEDYIPYTHNWNEKTYKIKLKNIAKVIKDLNPDIIALQEIESLKVLKDLNSYLHYPYFAIAHSRFSPVKNAIFSKYKIIKKEEIEIKDIKRARNILKVTIDIENNTLIIFINHWKSKHAPESIRVIYAKALLKEIKKLNCKSDYIVLGDFNSNYNEFQTLLYEPLLNDTLGITGINHILPTIYKNRFVNEDFVKKHCGYLYNLWLEIPSLYRFSYIFKGKKNTLDNILLPKSMFDKYGVNYIDNSFNVFRPKYLYKNRHIYRWKIKRDRHLGKGYSDHLPIYAIFDTKPFYDKKEFTLKKIKIKNLYEQKPKEFDAIIENAAVLLRYKNIAIIKRGNDRAIMIYNAPDNLNEKNVYDIEILKTKRYKGNLEIVKTGDFVLKKTLKKVDQFFIKYKDQVLSKKIYQNEIITDLKGTYKNGYLFYKRGKIKLYFKDRSLIPKNNSKILIKRGHISYYYKPQIVIYYKKDFLIL
ncbi:endonuclease/exonuclease/phosphatase family protein [Nitrosophilus kaiyonis]|uniref:endonuclease/exonuclease/phosphatase family protein n=1 Tax=Nitrosophilus kaiyonis TaxID=2930200 RepID=UPI0024922615|nr:endonuclease/exonuclease/phosphatase family protein [Nitrosophilus kaiyonis]